MSTEFIIPLITAFGVGSIISVVTQSWLTRKTNIEKLNFQERKEAYIGLLEAYHRAAIENTDIAAKNFAYWQLRCELVAPASVRKAIAKIVETNDDSEARYLAHDNLKQELRKDLGITLN